MTTAEYILATRKQEIVQAPTKLDDVTDLARLDKGLKCAMEFAYNYIENFDKQENKNMTDLRNAVDTIQFTTAQLSSVRIAYNDLVKRILDHNEQLTKEQENKA